MIAYKSHKSYDNYVAIVNSMGDAVKTDDLAEIFDYLLRDYGNQFKVAWDINEFSAPILALLTKEQLSNLFEHGKAFVRPYTIRFNQSKSLYIKKGGWFTMIYHLSQYYDTDPEPANLQGVIDKGAELLAELDTIDIQPAKLTSPITMLDQIWDEVIITKYKDTPDEMNRLAWECCGRNWVEAIKVGHIDKAWDYDIQAAYPWAMSELLDLRYGKFVESKDYIPDAVYGFAQGKATIDPQVKISPIIYTNKSGHQFNITGSYPIILPKQDIDIIRDYQIGKFKIDYAWWWIPKLVVDKDSPNYKPLYNLMHRLFGQRQKSQLLNRILKRASAGVSGKLKQVYENKDGDKFAPHFNSIYGAMAETEPKLKVARFIYDNKLIDNTLHISTDGALLDKEQPMKYVYGMGEWRLDSTSPALIVSSGNLFYGLKHPAQLFYADAVELIAKDLKARNWEKKLTRRMTMGDVLMDNFAKLGEEKEVITGFGLDIEHDRHFERLPANGRELMSNLYDSRMWSVKNFR